MVSCHLKEALERTLQAVMTQATEVTFKNDDMNIPIIVSSLTTAKCPSDPRNQPREADPTAGGLKSLRGGGPKGTGGGGTTHPCGC